MSLTQTNKSLTQTNMSLRRTKKSLRRTKKSLKESLKSFRKAPKSLGENALLTLIQIAWSNSLKLYKMQAQPIFSNEERTNLPRSFIPNSG